MNDNLSRTLAAVAIVVAIVACFLPASSLKGIEGTVVSTTNFDNLGVSSVLIGTNCNNEQEVAGGYCTGSQVSQLNFGACNIQGAATIAASSTALLECNGSVNNGALVPLAGVTVGANVDVSLGTTSPTTFEGLRVVGASASSTPGSITLYLYNGTGATYTWTAAASSSFDYQILHS